MAASRINHRCKFCVENCTINSLSQTFISINAILVVILQMEIMATRAVLRLVWPSILLQSARDRVATAAETDRVTAMERHVRKTV